MATAKRDLLLETAERLFYTEGFHATGIDRIVQAAGVVRMTLYNHFPSKTALVAAVLARRHARFLGALDAALADAPDGRASWALVEAHNAWLRGVGQHGCILMKAVGEFSAHAPEIREQARAAKADLRRRIADALARDGLRTDGGLVEQVFLVLEGANAGVPLIGADATLRHTRATLAPLLPTRSPDPDPDPDPDPETEAQ